MLHWIYFPGPEFYIPELMKPQQHHCGEIRSCRLVLINTRRFVRDIRITEFPEMKFSRWTFLESYDSAYIAISAVFMNSFCFQQKKANVKN